MKSSHGQVSKMGCTCTYFSDIIKVDVVADYRVHSHDPGGEWRAVVAVGR